METLWLLTSYEKYCVVRVIHFIVILINIYMIQHLTKRSKI